MYRPIWYKQGAIRDVYVCRKRLRVNKRKAQALGK